MHYNYGFWIVYRDLLNTFENGIKLVRDCNII